MMTPMRTKLFGLIASVVLAASAMPAHAQAPADDETPKDARMEGFARDGTGGVASLALAPSGTAGTWFLSVGLGIMMFGIMCKNGKRTHLD
ncbi:MAG: hypothetical protein JWM57_1012 [Phycisphaerales bacterium]|nr:hypothetical protein [Phycisphaerales bacterium]